MKSTIILAFDQHAATTVAAVLLPGADVGAAHMSTPAENPTVPPVENPTDRRGDEPQIVAAS